MTRPVLGIDIAKLKFNVCLIHLNGKLKHKVFPNHATGFEQFRQWLTKQGVECATPAWKPPVLMAKLSRSVCMRPLTR